MKNGGLATVLAKREHITKDPIKERHGHHSGQPRPKTDRRLISNGDTVAEHPFLHVVIWQRVIAMRNRPACPACAPIAFVV